MLHFSTFRGDFTFATKDNSKLTQLNKIDPKDPIPTITNWAFKLWSYSYIWKYLFIFASQCLVASSYSPSNTEGLIFLNSPCNSPFYLLGSLWYETLSDSSSLLSWSPFVFAWPSLFLCVPILFPYSWLGIRYQWFCRSGRIFIILSCSCINLWLSTLNLSISLFSSYTVSNRAILTFQDSSTSCTHISELDFVYGTESTPIFNIIVIDQTLLAVPLLFHIVHKTHYVILSLTHLGHNVEMWVWYHLSWLLITYTKKINYLEQ